MMMTTKIQSSLHSTVKEGFKKHSALRICSKIMAYRIGASRALNMEFMPENLARKEIRRTFATKNKKNMTSFLFAYLHEKGK